MSVILYFKIIKNISKYRRNCSKNVLKLFKLMFKPIHRMESSGRPEQVHISEQTCGFLGDKYNLEEGEEVDGKFFVHQLSIQCPS